MSSIGRISLLLVLLFATPSAFAKYQTVILISIDGLGSHLKSLVKTPNLDRIAAEGSAAKRATTVQLAKTIPGHVSMLTGVSPDVHKLTHNEQDENLTKISVPSIFDLVKKNGMTSSAVVGKSKIAYVIDTGAVENIENRTIPLIGDFTARTPSYVRAKTIDKIKAGPPRFLFVHFAWVDTMGHWFQWESSIQKNAVKNVDEAVGKIMEAAKESLPEGSYAVVITADHGGHEGSHGQSTDGVLHDPERDLYIPWIVWPEKIKPDVETVRIEDTSPSIAALLGIEVPKEYNWSGQSVILERK